MRVLVEKVLGWVLAGVQGSANASEAGAGLGGRVVGVAAGAGAGVGAGADAGVGVGAGGMVVGWRTVGGDARRIYVRGKDGVRVCGC